MKFRCIIFVLSSLYTLSLKAQDFPPQKNIIYEVDSLLNEIKKDGSDQILLYYSDGVAKTGIVLWNYNKKICGVAFRKTLDKFEVKSINKSKLNKNKLIENFHDSLVVLKKSVPYYTNISHDFTLMWVYFNGINTDTVYRKVSEVMQNGNDFSKSLFLEHNRIYELTIPPINSSLNRHN